MKPCSMAMQSHILIAIHMLFDSLLTFGQFALPTRLSLIAEGSLDILGVLKTLE
jgi:hypothetical protein